MGQRTFIVGDVHGCIVELDRLLERVALDADDRVVFVGDLVAKGPDSRAVVRRAREVDARAVRGNHEEHLLTHRCALLAGRPLPRLGRGHQAVVEALDEGDWAYLEALPLALALPEHRALVVHAGLVPGVPLERQEPAHLLNMRSLRPDGTPSKRVDEGAPWAALWPGPERVFFGHDAIRGLQLHRYAFGLDTGCVYGNELTAVELPSMRRHTIPADRVWVEPKGRRLPRRVTVGPLRDLRPGQVRTFPLGRDAAGLPIEALVLRDEAGAPRAYRNLCKHLPVPLDGGSRQFFSGDGRLCCGTHGALYRLEDGYCEVGPCRGTYLEPFRVRIERGDVVLLLDDDHPRRAPPLPSG